MIKCNLSVLLAERGLKMIDIVRDTGLSQNAVRGLYYNTSKGIQFETLEIICDYLKVEPGDVIKKIDFDFKVIDKKVDKKDESIKYKIKFIYDQKKYTGSLKVNLSYPYLRELYNNENSFEEINFEIELNDELNKNIFSQITELEIDKIERKLVDDFIKTFGLDNDLITNVVFVVNNED